jgi:hypothetical protein
MRRIPVLVVLAALLVLALGGCGTGSGSDVTTETTPATSEEPAAVGSAIPGEFDPIATDGPGESAAVAALPAALDEGKSIREADGSGWPDLSGAEPVMTAYIILVQMGDQGTLCEVHADGVAHSLYAYQKAFDAATLIWSPREYSTSPVVEPRSDVEKAAVAAIEAEFADAFPDDEVSVGIYGYRFNYLRDGASALTLEMTTDGRVISVGD